MRLFSRIDDSLLARWWWTVDKRFLIMVLALMFIGVMMVATASPPVAERIDLSSFHFLFRHLFFLALGLGGFLSISLLKDRYVWRFATVLFFLSLAGVVMTLLGGDEIKGAQRWIRVVGFSVQPSEFLKIGFIGFNAWLLAKQKEYDQFPGILFSLSFFSLCVVLLLMQPDYGMTMVLVLAFGVQIFLSGCPLRTVLVFGVFVVALSVISYFTLPHVQSRVDRFLNPDSGDTFQIDKSLEAFQNGGVFGKGPGQGEVKHQLPDAHSDFIFSVIAEEFGLISVLIVIGLYCWILLHVFTRLRKSESVYAIYACGGVMTIFALQAFIHMGSALQILPAKGMTLPFISYGGSSLMAMSFGMGMVLALTRRQNVSAFRRSPQVITKNRS